ncbi:MAG: LamG domain-containing protein, partial [Candidatus Daviesbacteria bacterium]|nr:LamG domain-containing protein [Candidatus Daviesbacteria bacterium]
PSNEWLHLVATQESTDGGANTLVKLYVNGALVRSQTLTGRPTTTSRAVYIGVGDGTTQWIKGLIDEVRIYSQALTVGEIQKHYAEGLARHEIVLK